MKKMLKKRLAVLVVLLLIVQASFMTPFFTFKAAIKAQEGIETEQEKDEEEIDSSEAEAYVAGEEEVEEHFDEDAVVPDVQNGMTEHRASEVTFSEPAQSEEETQENYQTRGPPEESSILLTESRDTYLAFSSDVHNQSNNIAADRLGTWIDIVQKKFGNIAYIGFCGDMADYVAGSNYWRYTQEVIDAVSQRGIAACYTTGNHEYDHQHSQSNYYHELNSTTQYFTVDAAPSNLPEGANYSVYALGSISSSQSYSNDQINHLKAFLENADADKPIIVLAHFPLHYATQNNGSGRSTTNSGGVIDALNEAGREGKTVIFLWGHNHTLANSGENNYDKIFIPGDSIRYDSSTYRNIQFYYAAAGCMSDYSYSQGSAAVKGKGLVIQVRADGGIGFAYYDADGKDVTKSGNYPIIELEPVALTGLTIDQPVSTAVEVGRKLKLTATVLPSDATSKDVVWSSSDTSVATVNLNGTVTGVSEGEVTITATVNDTTTGVVFTDSITITVTERTSQEQYFVIKIGDYAMSSRHASVMMSNSNGYDYHGLEAVTYDPNAEASQDILWTLEEAAGTTNGYYIKSYSGEYLSATYQSNGRGYSGNLIVAEFPEEIWIINSGFDIWQESGSTLQSSNASTPSKAMYLATTQSNNSGPYFFTVRSTSDSTVQRTSQLIEPAAVAEPVPVTGITLDPAAIEIEAGKTTSLTASVLPENADDKTVTWSSTDESVATVNSDGRVKGIAEGEADITATTNDGRYTASCHVMVVPSTSEEQYFLIKIGDYAMSSRYSSASMSNNSGYHYHGLEAVTYDPNAEVPKDILWTLEEAEDITNGYYIKSYNGEYLSATYESNGRGYTGSLIVADSPQEIWIVNNGIENWQGDGSTLQSSNASTPSKAMYLATTQGNDNGPYFFTVRSTSDPSVQRTSQLIEQTSGEDSNPEKVRIASAQVGLEDQILVRFFLELNEGSPEDYTVVCSLTGNTTAKSLAAFERDAKGRYGVIVPVVAKKMTEPIDIWVTDENGNIISNQITYSVETFCLRKIKSDTSNEDLKNLCAAILNYGAYAQVKFGYNTGALANRSLNEYGYSIDVPDVTIPASEVSVNGTTEGITVGGATLGLDEAVAMRFRLVLDEGESIDDYICTCNGKVLTPDPAGTSAGKVNYYIYIRGISAKNMDNSYTVEIRKKGEGTLSVTYSVLTYLYNKSTAGDSALQDLCRVMYFYHITAKEYFANH